jgi:multidrug efflux system membrane fusion protein
VAIIFLYEFSPRFLKVSSTQPSAAPAARAVSVLVATAKRGDLPIYLDAPGTVVAFNTVTVRTRVDGQIMAVDFTEGQLVKEGDLLVQIDPRPFQVQLLQAQGQLAKDEALLKNAQLDLSRYEEAGRGATQQQVDTAKATIALQEGAVTTDQGLIESANLQLTYCRITAPFTGRIGLRLVDKGNIVHAADVNGLAVITQIQPISITFSLAQEYLPRVMKAQDEGRGLPVDALDLDTSAHLATGTLTAVDSQIDLTTLTAKFKATFENAEFTLFPNQAVKVRLQVDTLKDAVLIPVAAVQRSPGESFVYVVQSDNIVEMRPVELGPTEADTASIKQGLNPGEIVVTSGVDKLAPGARVTFSTGQKNT